MFSKAMPFSCKRRRTEGDSASEGGQQDVALGGVWVCSAGVVWTSCTLTIAKGSPTCSSSLGCTRICCTIPATGEGISLLTLSVETSRRGSSNATGSPTCLNHCTTVALTILSPSFGNTIFTSPLIRSNIIDFLIDFCNEVFPLLVPTCNLTRNFHK